jgi:hypothetical protein
MTIKDPELDDLFRDDHSEMAHERRHAGRTTGGEGRERSSTRTRHGGFTVTLRIKPDRRCLVTKFDPASERRHSRK